MERALATIDVITDLKPIEKADFLELATVRGWMCVVKKDDFKVGDTCVYFEIDSLLPTEPQFQFLEKGSGLKICNIDGSERKGYRLKTIKLRGQISQGLAMPTHLFPELADYVVGDDVTAKLGVYKYEGAIGRIPPAFAKGPFPGFIPKTDEERVQNMLPKLQQHNGVQCQITEKLDGMSATFYRHNGEFGVCSRNLDLKDGDNVFWNIARENNLESLPDGFAIQGEIIGPSIQGNPLMRSKPELYVFSIYDIKASNYLALDRLKLLVNDAVKTVPVITEDVIHTDIAKWIALAEGTSKLSSANREGIVIRSYGTREDMVSFKVISNSYLLKHDS